MRDLMRDNLFIDVCENCGSAMHDSKECDKPAKKFRTRQQMNLSEGELPFKYRVEIDPENDDEAEVTRKRALLRVNSNRIYTQMGFAVKAQEAHHNAIRHLEHLIDNSDDNEKKALVPLLSNLRQAAAVLSNLRSTKIAYAEQMEEFLTKAHSNTRKARVSQEKKAARKKAEFFTLRLPSGNGEALLDIPVSPESENPFEIFEQLGQNILKKERMGKLVTPPEDES